MGNRYMICLDVGGTKADAVLVRETGEIVAHVVDPAGAPLDRGCDFTLSNCKHTVERLLKYADGPVATLYAGIAAMEYYYDRFVSFFSEQFGDRIQNIRLEGDGCCLISAALGHTDGACLICGTGSSLYMRRGDSFRHIGGGGYMIDSCGSGYVLGRNAIQAVLRAANGSEPPTMLTQLLDEQAGTEMWDNMAEIYEKGRPYVASFAKNVFIARDRGDFTARRIFNECAADMANVVWAAYREMGPYTVVLNGGIFRNYPEYARAVRALSPSDVNFIFSELPPLYGCAVEAMHDLGLECGEDFKRRFLEDYEKKDQ